MGGMSGSVSVDEGGNKGWRKVEMGRGGGGETE